MESTFYFKLFYLKFNRYSVAYRERIWRGNYTYVNFD